MATEICTSEQRQTMLRMLKKGPQFGDKALLAEYAKEVYRVVTGRNLKEECDKIMAEYRASVRTYIW